MFWTVHIYVLDGFQFLFKLILRVSPSVDILNVN